ncbi:MAG: SDR family oxidoreductase [Myxococcales bacterium]|nr:SDR family oxidoreductase [Myxococcales bacterium]
MTPPTTDSKTILITGATAGIGRHAALYLAARGHDVLATGRKQAALEELARASGGRIRTLRLDVTDPESIAEAVRAVDELTGGRGLDVLVNNAGYGQAGAAAEIRDADLRAQFETNVFGLMAVTRAFLPAMMARRSGRVVNVSSVGGRLTLPLFGVYNATKYAVESLSDALRIELRPFGIQVSLVEPGPIKTEFADRTMSAIARYRDPSSPYAPVYARAEELRALTDRQAVGPEVVSRAIEKAATRRRPAARYVVPFSSRFALWLAALLPTRALDWVLARFAGLGPSRLEARPALPAPASVPGRPTA